MRVAVTGAGGRLGRALVAALEASPYTGPGGPIAWTRAAFDLDEPEGFAALLDRDRPEVIVHAAAWTDVDGCAREPDLALARNGTAAGALAEAAAERGIDLVVVSTNEVFDGRRTDGRGYGVADQPDPINSYGASKLAGERLAQAAYAGASAALGIVRTAWLYGPPGKDFPDKILSAAERARARGEPLKAGRRRSRVAHLFRGRGRGDRRAHRRGCGPRAAPRRERRCRVAVRVGSGGAAAGRRLGSDRGVPASEWPRDSTPPRWAVLEPTPLPSGQPLRAWPQALADYLPTLLRHRAVAGSTAG